MKWATRKNMQIDRAACVWLIRKRIDTNAEILFVEEQTIDDLNQQGVLTFDAKNAVYKHAEDQFGGKYGEKCTFQVMLSEYSLEGKDPALDYLASIVYAADIGHRINIYEPKEGYGLWALTKGLSVTIPEDSQKLDLLLSMFDAIYEYCVWHVNNSEYN